MLNILKKFTTKNFKLINFFMSNLYLTLALKGFSIFNPNNNEVN